MDRHAPAYGAACTGVRIGQRRKRRSRKAMLKRHVKWGWRGRRRQVDLWKVRFAQKTARLTFRDGTLPSVVDTARMLAVTGRPPFPPPKVVKIGCWYLALDHRRIVTWIKAATFRAGIVIPKAHIVSSFHNVNHFLLTAPRRLKREVHRKLSTRTFGRCVRVGGSHVMTDSIVTRPKHLMPSPQFADASAARFTRRILCVLPPALRMAALLYLIEDDARRTIATGIGQRGNGGVV